MTDARIKRKDWLWGVAASLLLALAFSLIFYAFNTPLGPSIGSDNAMYLTMGTALANGYAPYTEIFDHKGPVLFLIQWLPQALSGGYSTLAVFVQEVLVLAGCLLVLRAIARELRVSALGVQLVYLALTCSLVGGGNLTEEYTNLPTLIGLYAALRAFGGEEKRERLFFPAALMGACFAFAFLTRANNALPLSAVTAVLSLGLLVSRRFASLLRCAAGFLLGLAAVTLPVVLWLAARGALFDAFYGAIIHNFLYAEAGGGSRMQMLLHAGYGRVAMVMAALACMGALVLYRKRRALWFSLAMVAGAAAGGLAAFISHKFYDHYLMIGAPVAALGAAALLMAFEGRTRRAALGIAALVCCAWLCVKGQETNAWRLSEREGWDAFAANAQALMAKVPEQERDRFMAYRVEPKWYVAAEALPCMRFYFLQEILGQVNPAVMDEIAKTFESDPPLWLVIYYNRAYDPPYDPRVEAIFETRYAFVDAAGDYQLLRLIEP